MSEPISIFHILAQILEKIGIKVTADYMSSPVKNFLSKLNPFNQNKAGTVCDLSTLEQQKLFYQKVKEIYENASRDIYITGIGIRPADDKDIFLSAEEGLRKALHNGVRLYRFQTSATWIEQWGKTYISLIRDYPDSIEIYEDFQNSQIMSIALIDPDGQNPIVIETRQTQNYKDEHQITVLSVGTFIYNKKDLAVALKNQLLERKKTLTKIDLKVSQ